MGNEDEDQDLTAALAEGMRQAHDAKTPLYLIGGDTKPFWGRGVEGRRFSLLGHRGVIRYEPTELVLTARAGTPLVEIHRLLAAHGQWLPFEPPSFGSAATLGGTIACGLSGPARPFLGAARDFVLGVRVLDGRGQVLRFGGEVIKNVAGYDVARFLTGAQGTLGALLEVSLKVHPKPPVSETLARKESAEAAIQLLVELAAQPFPLTAACHDGERLFLRFHGTEGALQAATNRIGGDRLADADSFWESVREQTHPFFSEPGPLWRLSVPPATLPLAPGRGALFLDWGGAQRWWKGLAEPAMVWNWAREKGGHAMLFDSGQCHRQPIDPDLLSLHKRLKHSFDPEGILNPGRLYETL
ncbi:glycolate oxidase FAD binding subunit [Methylacidimicrobium cyclopophantes]|uniref:Glycolate oxidase FAD binding subunit n=1 Tax=Methylacidimicrobium cyclopophantes TaxID=1041766 RepID=A0A5E6MI69_9BACT|nr:glycolate oxidase subunit GlcE [Methylacidimicrobium cyclopophantes]VVM05187.1 glycolate oxidase FAD binding subunit [Methylacidimicrobium cyclopophantes]